MGLVMAEVSRVALRGHVFVLQTGPRHHLSRAPHSEDLRSHGGMTEFAAGYGSIRAVAVPRKTS